MAVEIRAPIGSVDVSSQEWEADARSAVSIAEATSASHTVEFATGVITGGVPYEGSYDVTPGSEAQELATEGRVMRHNVTVGAIPSNYGLIEWNGTVLTVS